MRIPAFIHLPSDALAPAPSRIDHVAMRVMARLLARFRHWHAERRTLEEIAKLDDATLRDIGVDRWTLRERLRSERRREDAAAGLWRGRP